MDLNFLKQKPKNRVRLTGIITQNPHFSNNAINEESGHFESKIAVQRKSGYLDEVVIVLRNTKENLDIAKKGNIVELEGFKNSKNQIIENKSKLVLYVSVKKISLKNEEHLEEVNIKNPNIVELEGYLCKTPIFRETPQGRQIVDVMLAVNRPYPSNRTDYIPLIAWGYIAERISKLEIGSKIWIEGRVQSREYEKQIDNFQVEKRTAYEVSVNKFNIIL